MAHYVRTNHVLKGANDKDTFTCDSINKAKKKSTELQKSGNTVATSKKRTHRLHMCTAKR